MCINERVIFMSAKEQLINIIDFIGEKEANSILTYVKETFLLKPKSWDDIEEDEPTSDEIDAFEEFRTSQV